MKTPAQSMMSLFSGMKEAHGEYIISDEPSEDGKKKKGRAFTKREPATSELWERHLSGEQTLGIIPIKSDNTCLWGAIDIDDYNLDLVTFAIRVHKLGLPLMPCRSKSGGCHLIMFLKEPVMAKALQEKLSEIAAILGYGRSEIFPKQTKVLVDKGDLGNWLNMPYFGSDNGTRYALGEKGEAVPLLKFLKWAGDLRLTIDQFENLDIQVPTNNLPDGPPCLQVLCDQGFPQGTRNNGLFALGVYCRKAFPDNWESKMEEMNSKYMDPPLESKEVQTLKKQCSKKDWNYRCSDQPLAAFCNAAVCRTRAHGIGGGAMPTMGGLSKIPTDQPVWFLDVNGIRIELTTDELQQQSRFQKACMNYINFMPPKITDRMWQSLIQTLLDKCDILDKPKEASLSDQFKELVATFCTDSRIRASTREEILLGRPWLGTHPEDDEEPRVFFRLRDLEEFLIRHNFKYYNRSQMIARLTSTTVDAQGHFFKIKGKGVNVFHISEPEDMDEPFGLPDMGEKVL